MALDRDPPPPGLIVDFAIAALARRRATIARIRPTRTGHALDIALRDRTLLSYPLEAACALACVARIAAMAELDLHAEWATADAVSRLRVLVDGEHFELLASVASIADRHLAELRVDTVDSALAESLPPASPDELRPGSVLGSYVVAEQLGAGGTGIVYRAEHTLLQRDVAIKVMRVAEHDDDRQRFLAEARAATRITHENVVGVHDFGFLGDGRAFIVMELASGTTLFERLANRGPLPYDEALRIARQIAAGLAAVHEGGVVHNDVKPANVLLDERRARVVDFGAATLVGAPRPAIVYGTVPYMSPEQVEGLATGPASDLYALGAVLFEMISGAPPFGASTDRDVMGAHLFEAPPPLTGRYGPVPPALQALVAALLEKAPEHRPRGARETVARIDTILQGLPWTI